MNAAKVIVADRERAFCDLLCRQLKSEQNMRLVGTAGDGWELLWLIRGHNPDILVMDLSLNNALVLLPYVHRREKRMKILVVSSSVNDLPELPEPESGIYYYRKNDGRVEGLLQCMRDIAGVVPVPQDRGGEDRGTLEVRISLLLREFGVPANIKGYQYLRKAIQMAVETPESMSAVTKILYPDIAKCHGTTASCVERAMRSAIEVAWDRGNLECLHRYFGYTINPRAGRPTNSEFIATIADALGMEEKYPESTA